MTRRNPRYVSGADLTSVVNANLGLFARVEGSVKKEDSLYRICDFIAPGKGFFDFMFRNSERFLRTNNCVRDFVYTAALGAVHIGYGALAVYGISKLLE
ncbi:MAG: hypothetical protein ACP5NS_04315 [Candidatus Pacearchaeota archaeon]